MNFLGQIGIGLLTFLLVQYLLAVFTLGLSPIVQLLFYVGIWLFWQVVFRISPRRNRGR